MLDEDYNFFKDENLNTNSDSISLNKEDNSTYMGVKTIQEGTVADTNKKENIIKQEKSPKKIKTKKKSKKTKKKGSSSSFSESSFSSFTSSSGSYIEIKEDLLEEKKSVKDEKFSDEESIKNKANIKKNNKEENNNNNNNGKIIKNEIKTEFHWDEGGNVIYLTGSFCDWKDFYLMEKNDKGIFIKTLMLPPGFYQYKFKVDNNWAFSKKQPKFEDNDRNVNNFIDTTNYEKPTIPEKKEEKEIGTKSEKNNLEIKLKKAKEENKQKDLKRNISNNSIGFLNNANYSTYKPLKGELSSKPLALPGLYKTHYILNEKKNKKIEERKFSQIEYVDQTNNSIHKQNTNKDYFVNNNIYVGFQNLYHIHSNHLHSKEIQDSKNIVTSIITRYRAKFSTFIYYKDKTQRERSGKKHSKTVKINKGMDEKIGKIVKRHKNAIYK